MAGQHSELKASQSPSARLKIDQSEKKEKTFSESVAQTYYVIVLVLKEGGGAAQTATRPKVITLTPGEQD